MNIKKLYEKAKKLRLKTFQAFVEKGEAHLGGSFSMIEIIICLFYAILKKKDKFILSKSHASYPFCLLLRDLGYKPKLTTHLEIDKKNKIFCTTGSLGHGYPISTGMALARKKLNKKGKIYVLVSDGECQEGTTWESSLIASKYKLDNLVLIIDYNKIQALTTLKEGLPLGNLKNKFKSFNFKTIIVKDGHNLKELIACFKKAGSSKQPTVLIVNTIKGKGVKKFENDPAWHARKIEGKDIKLGMESLNK